MKKKIYIFFVLFFLIVMALILFLGNRPNSILLQGEVESNRVDIAARVQGRVVDYFYDVGDNVTTGDLLLILSSPPLLAQQTTVQAQLNVAIASRDNIYSTRPETIEAQKAALEKSESDLVLAKQNYDRIKNLANKDAISKQSYDEAYNQYQSAINARDAAKANLNLAIQGNSIEAKKLADAQVTQAFASLEQINTDIAELNVVAPTSGQITARIAEIGQLYSPGTPLYSIIDLNDIWFTFNIREDFLDGIKVGDTFMVQVPSLNNKQIEVKVTVLNALGQYANWRATKATGDFDLKTFEMRAKPIEPITGLRPGMSATAIWETKTLK